MGLFLNLIILGFTLYLLVFPCIIVYAVFTNTWLPAVLPEIFPLRLPGEEISPTSIMPLMPNAWYFVVVFALVHGLLMLVVPSGTRLSQEVNRKSAHLYGVAIPMLYYFGLRIGGAQWPIAAIMVSTAALVVVAFDHFRVTYPDSDVGQNFAKYWGAHLRPHERRGPSASRYFFAGMALSIVLFPPGIGVLAQLGLVVGDYAAAIVGLSATTFLGSHNLPGAGKKSFEGFFGCTIAIATLAYCGGFSAVTSLVAGFAGSIAEAYTIGIDDNLSLPVAIGLALRFVA